MITAQEARDMLEVNEDIKENKKNKKLYENAKKEELRAAKLLLKAEKAIAKALSHDKSCVRIGYWWSARSIKLCAEKLRNLGYSTYYYDNQLFSPLRIEW